MMIINYFLLSMEEQKKALLVNKITREEKLIEYQLNNFKQKYYHHHLKNQQTAPYIEELQHLIETNGILLRDLADFLTAKQREAAFERQQYLITNVIAKYKLTSGLLEEIESNKSSNQSLCEKCKYSIRKRELQFVKERITLESMNRVDLIKNLIEESEKESNKALFSREEDKLFMKEFQIAMGKKEQILSMVINKTEPYLLELQSEIQKLNKDISQEINNIDAENEDFGNLNWMKIMKNNVNNKLTTKLKSSLPKVVTKMYDKMADMINDKKQDGKKMVERQVQTNSLTAEMQKISKLEEKLFLKEKKIQKLEKEIEILKIDKEGIDKQLTNMQTFHQRKVSDLNKEVKQQKQQTLKIHQEKQKDKIKKIELGKRQQNQNLSSIKHIINEQNHQNNDIKEDRDNIQNVQNVQDYQQSSQSIKVIKRKRKMIINTNSSAEKSKRQLKLPQLNKNMYSFGTANLKTQDLQSYSQNLPSISSKQRSMVEIKNEAEKNTQAIKQKSSKNEKYSKSKPKQQIKRNKLNTLNDIDQQLSLKMNKKLKKIATIKIKNKDSLTKFKFQGEIKKETGQDQIVRRSQRKNTNIKSSKPITQTQLFEMKKKVKDICQQMSGLLANGKTHPQNSKSMSINTNRKAVISFRDRSKIISSSEEREEEELSGVAAINQETQTDHSQYSFINNEIFRNKQNTSNLQGIDNVYTDSIIKKVLDQCLELGLFQNNFSLFKKDKGNIQLVGSAVTSQQQNMIDITKSQQEQLFGSIFTPSNYSIFITAKIAYKYEISFSKSHHKYKQISLSKNQQRAMGSIFAMTEIIRKFKKHLYKKLCSFIRYPYTTIENSFESIDLVKDISLDSFQNYFKRMIFYHQKCQIVKGKEFCSHVEDFTKYLSDFIVLITKEKISIIAEFAQSNQEQTKERQ